MCCCGIAIHFRGCSSIVAFEANTALSSITSCATSPTCLWLTDPPFTDAETACDDAHLRLKVLMQAMLTQLQTFAMMFTRIGIAKFHTFEQPSGASMHADVNTWVKQRLAKAA